MADSRIRRNGRICGAQLLIAWALGRLRVLASWALVLACAAAPASGQAQASPHSPDQIRVLSDALLLAGQTAERPPDDDDLAHPADWRHVALPHLWADTHGDYEGSLWYRLRVKLPARPGVPWAVYLPRVVMNAQVWVNGVPLDYTGSMVDPVTRHWYVPLLFQVPASAWRAGENLVEVRVASGYQARNGLAPIQIGPLEALATVQRHRRWAQVDAVHIAHVGLISLGLLMVIVWLRDRAQSAVGYMGAAAVFWGASTLMGIAPYPLTGLKLWEDLSYTATVWHQLALCAFFFRFARPWPWVERLIGAMAVALPLFYVSMPGFESTALVYVAIFGLALAGMGVAVTHVIRYRRPDGGWLVLGCAVLLPAGAHDVMVQLGSLPFDSVYWLPLAGPVLIACMVVILAGDYARSRAALYELNQSLASRVAEREQALRLSFERLAALESAQAVSAERSRILKDMHDGVGAHLTSALRQLQGSQGGVGHVVDVPLVTQTLRDSLDQLKLSIDAMSLQPGDVVGLLASWRFRLTPRLKAAGLELVWDVDELPCWPTGQTPALQHLQYILFEGLSNVLQHSGATRLVLSARDMGDHLRLSLIDNGRGCTQGPTQRGQGLQTMRGRAGMIGARIEFLTPGQGGLELRLSLPLRAVHDAGQSGLSSAA